MKKIPLKPTLLKPTPLITGAARLLAGTQAVAQKATIRAGR